MARGKHRVMGLVRAWRLSVVLSLVLVQAGEAHAQEPQAPVELEWIRLEGAEVCPPKSAFRRALEKRLGKLPFSGRANRVLTVSLSNENGPFRAVLSLKEKSAQEVESKQELFSYSSLCDEVFAATVLSVALLLNPDEANRSEKPFDEEEDSGFFDPIERAAEATPEDNGQKEESPQERDNNKREAYTLPVAPHPWARRHGYVGAFMIVALEQLPSTGTGLALRAELPLARRWLFTMEADWVGAQPIDTSRTATLISQSSGWLGSAWVPHETQHFELWIEGALGLRVMHASAREALQRESHVHLAARLGLAPVVHLTRHLALSGVASAIFPFAEENFQAWTQPALGGQIQLGVLVGFGGPNR